MKKKKKISFAAFLLLPIYFLNLLSESAPAFAFSAESSLMASGKIAAVHLPESLGEMRQGIFSESINNTTIYSIQDAHASSEAQNKIYQILNYIQKNQGLDAVLVEGASGRLNSKLLNRFFRVEDNRGFWNRLLNKGLINGAVYYLLHHQNIPAYGLENPSAYRENLESYRQVLRQKKSADLFLRDFEVLLQNASVKWMTDELRAFLKIWKMQYQPDAELDHYFKELFPISKKYLGIDWSDYHTQVEWPNLIRLHRLFELQKKFPLKGLKKEISELTIYLQTGHKELLNRLQWMLEIYEGKSKVQGRLPFSSRKLAEDLVEAAKERGVSLSKYTDIKTLIAASVFEEEIQGEKLFDEIHRLENELFDKITRGNQKAESLVGLYRVFHLMKSGFGLELTREQVREFNVKVRKLDWKRVKKQLGVNRLTEEMAVIRLIPQVARFYYLAELREKAFFKNLSHLTADKKGKALKVALIAGGYHEAGIRQLIQSHSLNYHSVRPKLESVASSGFYQSHLMGRYETTATLAEPQPDLMMNLVTAREMMGSSAFEARAQAVGSLLPKRGGHHSKVLKSTSVRRSEIRILQSRRNFLRLSAAVLAFFASAPTVSAFTIWKKKIAASEAYELDLSQFKPVFGPKAEVNIDTIIRGIAVNDFETWAAGAKLDLAKLDKQMLGTLFSAGLDMDFVDGKLVAKPKVGVASSGLGNLSMFLLGPFKGDFVGAFQGSVNLIKGAVYGRAAEKRLAILKIRHAYVRFQQKKQERILHAIGLLYEIKKNQEKLKHLETHLKFLKKALPYAIARRDTNERKDGFELLVSKISAWIDKTTIQWNDVKRELEQDQSELMRMLSLSPADHFKTVVVKEDFKVGQSLLLQTDVFTMQNLAVTKTGSRLPKNREIAASYLQKQMAEEISRTGDLDRYASYLTQLSFLDNMGSPREDANVRNSVVTTPNISETRSRTYAKNTTGAGFSMTVGKPITAARMKALLEIKIADRQLQDEMTGLNVVIRNLADDFNRLKQVIQEHEESRKIVYEEALKHLQFDAETPGGHLAPDEAAEIVQNYVTEKLADIDRRAEVSKIYFAFRALGATREDFFEGEDLQGPAEVVDQKPVKNNSQKKRSEIRRGFWGLEKISSWAVPIAILISSFQLQAIDLDESLLKGLKVSSNQTESSRNGVIPNDRAEVIMRSILGETERSKIAEIDPTILSEIDRLQNELSKKQALHQKNEENEKKLPGFYTDLQQFRHSLESELIVEQLNELIFKSRVLITQGNISSETIEVSSLTIDYLRGEMERIQRVLSDLNHIAMGDLRSRLTEPDTEKIRSIEARHLTLQNQLKRIEPATGDLASTQKKNGIESRILNGTNPFVQLAALKVYLEDHSSTDLSKFILEGSDAVSAASLSALKKRGEISEALHLWSSAKKVGKEVLVFETLKYMILKPDLVKKLGTAIEGQNDLRPLFESYFKELVREDGDSRAVQVLVSNETLLSDLDLNRYVTENSVGLRGREVFQSELQRRGLLRTVEGRAPTKVEGTTKEGLIREESYAATALQTERTNTLRALRVVPPGQIDYRAFLNPVIHKSEAVPGSLRLTNVPLKAQRADHKIISDYLVLDGKEREKFSWIDRADTHQLLVVFDYEGRFGDVRYQDAALKRLLDTSSESRLLLGDYWIRLGADEKDSELKKHIFNYEHLSFSTQLLTDIRAAQRIFESASSDSASFPGYFTYEKFIYQVFSFFSEPSGKDNVLNVLFSSLPHSRMLSTEYQQKRFPQADGNFLKGLERFNFRKAVLEAAAAVEFFRVRNEGFVTSMVADDRTGFVPLNSAIRVVFNEGNPWTPLTGPVSWDELLNRVYGIKSSTALPDRNIAPKVLEEVIKLSEEWRKNLQEGKFNAKSVKTFRFREFFSKSLPFIYIGGFTFLILSFLRKGRRESAAARIKLLQWASSTSNHPKWEEYGDPPSRSEVRDDVGETLSDSMHQLIADEKRVHALDLQNIEKLMSQTFKVVFEKEHKSFGDFEMLFTVSRLLLTHPKMLVTQEDLYPSKKNIMERLAISELYISRVHEAVSGISNLLKNPRRTKQQKLELFWAMHELGQYAAAVQAFRFALLPLQDLDQLKNFYIPEVEIDPEHKEIELAHLIQKRYANMAKRYVLIRTIFRINKTASEYLTRARMTAVNAISRANSVIPELYPDDTIQRIDQKTRSPEAFFRQTIKWQNALGIDLDLRTRRYLSRIHIVGGLITAGLMMVSSVLYSPLLLLKLSLGIATLILNSMFSLVIHRRFIQGELSDPLCEDYLSAIQSHILEAAKLLKRDGMELPKTRLEFEDMMTRLALNAEAAAKAPSLTSITVIRGAGMNQTEWQTVKAEVEKFTRDDITINYEDNSGNLGDEIFFQIPPPSDEKTIRHLNILLVPGATKEIDLMLGDAYRMTQKYQVEAGQWSAFEIEMRSDQFAVGYFEHKKEGSITVKGGMESQDDAMALKDRSQVGIVFADVFSGKVMKWHQNPKSLQEIEELVEDNPDESVAHQINLENRAVEQLMKFSGTAVYFTKNPDQLKFYHGLRSKLFQTHRDIQTGKHPDAKPNTYPFQLNNFWDWWGPLSREQVDPDKDLAGHQHPRVEALQKRSAATSNGVFKNTVSNYRLLMEVLREERESNPKLFPGVYISTSTPVGSRSPQFKEGIRQADNSPEPDEPEGRNGFATKSLKKPSSNIKPKQGAKNKTSGGVPAKKQLVVASNKSGKRIDEHFSKIPDFVSEEGVQYRLLPVRMKQNGKLKTVWTVLFSSPKDDNILNGAPTWMGKTWDELKADFRIPVFNRKPTRQAVLDSELVQSLVTAVKENRQVRLARGTPVIKISDLRAGKYPVAIKALKESRSELRQEAAPLLPEGKGRMLKAAIEITESILNGENLTPAQLKALLTELEAMQSDPKRAVMELMDYLSQTLNDPQWSRARMEHLVDVLAAVSNALNKRSNLKSSQEQKGLAFIESDLLGDRQLRRFISSHSQTVILFNSKDQARYKSLTQSLDLKALAQRDVFLVYAPSGTTAFMNQFHSVDKLNATHPELAKFLFQNGYTDILKFDPRKFKLVSRSQDLMRRISSETVAHRYVFDLNVEDAEVQLYALSLLMQVSDVENSKIQLVSQVLSGYLQQMIQSMAAERQTQTAA